MRGVINLPYGEWDALEILGKLSASPSPIPRDWIDNFHALNYSAWMEDTYVTFPTMLGLGAHLPMVRVLKAHYPKLPAPLGDLRELVAAVRESGTFGHVEQFELWLGGDRGAITAAFALVESMRKLRKLRWNVGDHFDWKQRESIFSQHDAEHALVIDQLDLSHLRLRWYQCSNLCVGCELPLVHSGETLEYLRISLDPTNRPEVVRDLTSVLRSTSFVRLRTLKLSIFEGTAELALSSVLRDEMLSTLSSYSCLRRLTLRCILPALEATLGLLTAPLCELRIAAAVWTDVDTGLLIIHGVLKTSPALRSLRRLMIDADEAASSLPSIKYAQPAVVEQLRCTCLRRRVRLTFVGGRPIHIEDP